MTWDDDDDSFYSSVNWEAQEAQATAARQQRAQSHAQAGPSSGAPAPSGGFGSGGPAAQPAGQGSSIRSLFWAGGATSSGLAQPPQQQEQLGYPPGPLAQAGQHPQPILPGGPAGGGQQLQGPPSQFIQQPSRLSGGAQQQQQRMQPPYGVGQGPHPPAQHTQQQPPRGPVSGGGYAGHQGPQPDARHSAGYQQQPAPVGNSGGTHHPSGGTLQQQAGAGSGGGQGVLMQGQLSLGQDRQLQLQLGYHDAVKAALTRLKCAWDQKARVWRFPIADHDRVLEALQRVKGVRVNVEPLHHVPMSVIQAALTSPDDSGRYCHIPSNLEAQLMPFQREGVKFALKHGGRALIGDEMGLGKTVQAIAVAAAYRDEWPVLVIAPSSLREQWADALHRWLGVTEDHIHVVHTTKDAASVPSRGLQFLIVSYNFVPKMDLDKRYQMIILDESHYIKDHSAQRTKATVPLLKAAKRVILLTGTPALNKPKEIFQQLAALVPAAKLTMKSFGERYCTGNRFDKYGGACNLSELNALLKGTVMVRRLKNEVLTQLPKKRRQQVYLTLEGEAKRELLGLQHQLDAVKQVFASLQRQQFAAGGALGGGAGTGRMEENKAIMEMYRKTAELKCDPVEEYVKLLLEGGQKFLIFAHHTVLLDAAEHSCNKKKVKYIRIDGKTPASERQKLVNRFQENEDVKVAVLSIRAAGVGLTLTAASTVVFSEYSWVPGELTQAEDRAHRIGQASSVNVYFLHVKSSIDDIIWASVQNKLENVGQALDGQDQSMELAGVRHMPERGQRALDAYLSQAPGAAAAAGASAAAGVQQQHVQQARPGSGSVKSPSKGQQATLHAFFTKPPQQHGPAQQQQQQQQRTRASPDARQGPRSSPTFLGAAALAQPAEQPYDLPQHTQQAHRGAGPAAGGWAQSTAPLHAPSLHANSAPAGPQQPGNPMPQQQPGRGAGPYAAGPYGAGGPGGPGAASASGKWAQFIPQQAQQGGAPRQEGARAAGWQAGGQENGEATGSGSFGGGLGGAGGMTSGSSGGGGGGLYAQMAGAKRNFNAMMQPLQLQPPVPE